MLIFLAEFMFVLFGHSLTGGLIFCLKDSQEVLCIKSIYYFSAPLCNLHLFLFRCAVTSSSFLFLRHQTPALRSVLPLTRCFASPFHLRGVTCDAKLSGLLPD